MQRRHITTIITESLALTLVLAGTAATTLTFQHAALGRPMLASIYQPLSYAGRDEQRPATAKTSGFQTLPSHVFLKVPFSPQAPFGNWSSPYDEACEEASVAMAMAWVMDEKITPERAKDEIMGQIAYENYHFGYSDDTALAQTLKLITNYYRYRNAGAVYDISLDDIKQELASGNLVLVPVAGRLLSNPYYSSPPLYHMLLVRGYDQVAQEFIVNDPGTRRGESYRYPYQTLFNAIHDWIGDEADLLGGRKGMIVVAPPESPR